MISKLNCKMQFLKSNVSDFFLPLTFKSLIFSLVSVEDFWKPFIVPDTAYINSMIPDAQDPGNHERLGRSGNTAQIIIANSYSSN